MTPIDKNVVNRHMAELEQALRYLNEKKSVTVKDLLSNIELRYAVERAFHLAIQSVLDIGSHLLAAIAENNIKTFADIPQRLGERGLINKALSARLVGMARFRNILVHEYVTVDTKKLHSFFKNLDDFRLFVKEIQRVMVKA